MIRVYTLFYSKEFNDDDFKQQGSAHKKVKSTINLGQSQLHRSNLQVCQNSIQTLNI